MEVNYLNNSRLAYGYVPIKTNETVNLTCDIKFVDNVPTEILGCAPDVNP